ncbi:DUF2894 domain-containing protein [Ideonella paludis]|uniref:DUF2894 domain-containing protein n=1 Tax=Ideonella paludis TaxID=1233411 RepID=UPI00362E57BC
MPRAGAAALAVCRLTGRAPAGGSTGPAGLAASQAGARPSRLPSAPGATPANCTTRRQAQAPAQCPGPTQPSRGPSRCWGLPGGPSATQARPELKSAQRFRESWAVLCAEEVVDQASTQAPQNAGPLNAHRLVLHTLGLLRDLSPTTCAAS